jgi:acetoacetyl-CoA synthetase
MGVAAYAFNDEGEPVYDEVGELVMTQPIPSMPLFFWGDTDGSRYFESYFEKWPGVWVHGDWLRLIPRPESVTGIIYGRSDSTINRHGIRMGTSEIYRVVEEFDEVLDALVVDLEYLQRESFMALFVVLRQASTVSGETTSKSSEAATKTGIPSDLRNRLMTAIREKLSARHLPNEIYAIPAVPRTLSGKKLEIPVKKILLGHAVDKAVNRASMANPESIDWFIDFAEKRATTA